MSEPATLWLVDGSSYLYRAFHALPPLTTSRGEPTGAVLGVLNMLNRLLKEEQPQYLAVVFDAPGRTFRDDLFEAYKAHRPPMPDDLQRQIGPLLESVEALGLPLLRIEGVEADDVIGTLAARASAAGMRTVVSTGDKDLAQLVDEKVTLVNTMTGSRLDEAGVKHKFDVLPSQIVDYLALVGDSADNIPGVPKVGPKTAAKWLNQYGTLDAIVDHASDIPGKVGESLRENLQQLELSRKLASIRCDLELGVEPERLCPGQPDRDRLGAIYSRLELNSLLRQLGDQPAAASEDATPDTGPAPSNGDYLCITDLASLEAWIQRLQAAEVFALDTETTSLDYMAARIVGLSFSVQAGEAAYVPLAHDYPGAPEQLPLTAVLDRLRPLLEDEATAKLGHHLKYDAHVLANHGIALAGMRHDSMLESYVLDSTATRHDMDSVARQYLGIKTVSYEEVAGKGAKQLPFGQVDVAVATRYAAEDADVTLRLHQKLWPALAQLPDLERLYREVEIPLLAVLFRMERRGVLVDVEVLGQQGKEIDRRIAEVRQEVFAAAGREFNLDSPKQLQEILFGELGLPVLRKTPTGQPSTAEDVLEELAGEFPLPQRILDYRGLAKLKSTYVDRLPEQVNPLTGRVHTSYHQAVAVTGRLSSSDPNLQNIPVRTAEGRRVRQAFVAPPGRVLLAADYSQIELRIMAHLSDDPGLLRAFAEDRDIHEATAAEVLGIDPAAVTPEQRRSAKAVNFGLIYGMSAFGLARQLGIGRGEAQAYVDRYFERYPGVKRYMEDTRRLAREQGYVETVFGRRLYLPDIRARNRQLQQYAERSAINAPMQGTAADIIKRAMIAVDDWIRREQPGAELVMQVHDELVLEVDEARLEAVRSRVVACMAEAASLKVPLKVEVGAGRNWDEAH
ncbi:MAG: DNA polymerase I [Steroidobacteraceae bacterium]